MGINRFKRLLELITFIQSNVHVTVYDIMNELDVSRSTAFRDLKILEDCGIPCSFDPKQGYRISSTFMLRIDSMTPIEVMAMSQLLGQLKLEHMDATRRCATKAIQKVLASLPQSARDIYQHHGHEHVTVLDGSYDVPDFIGERLSLLIDAIDNRVPVVCDIKLQGHVSRSVRLHPYHLIADLSQWYVWARVFPEGQMRSIEVDRLIRPLQTDAHFNCPEHAITQAWKQSWRAKPEGQMYHVQIRINSSAPGRFATTVWHHTQQRNIDKSGHLILSFDVDGLEEIAQWVWQYHPYIQVLSPTELKDRVGEKARSLIKSLSD
jgi:predicted DNA-binding transcriptional regulator YafY